MSEDDRQRRRRHAYVRNIGKISVIIILIIAVLTFVCVRPDWTVIKHATPDDLVHRGIIIGSGRLLMETVAGSPFNVTEGISGSEQEQVWTTVPDETVVVPKTRSIVEHPQKTSWPRKTSSNVPYDNTAEVGRSMARSKALTDIRGKLIKRIRHSTDRASRIGTFVDDEGNENVESVISPHTGVIRMEIRSNLSKINDYDDFTMQQTDMPTTVENYTSTRYFNANDFTFNKGGEDSKEGRSADDGTGWSPIFRHEQELAAEPSPTGTSSGLGGSGGLKPPPVGLGARYSADQDYEYRVQPYTSNGAMNPWDQFMTFVSPSYWMGSVENQSIPVGNRQTTLQPPTIDNRQLPNTPPVQGSMPGFQQQMIASVPTINGINWRRIGAMAVIKLGLVKLKAIGFINILLFLLFKIKIFMAVVFFKFLSLLKFMKLFKFMIIPLLVIPFLPILASLIYPMNRVNPQVLPTSSNFNIRPYGSSEESGERVLIPGETILIPGSSTTVARPQNFPNGGIPNGVADALNFLSGQRYEPSALLDPESDLFRKELESEKCVERIACKMAATGKAGIMPLWINWMLHGMTKSIPNDKFVYYLKAYDDVTNEIHTESPNPDNWEKWCFERYDCDNETDETDAR